jgi:hypothetical protein
MIKPEAFRNCIVSFAAISLISLSAPAQQSSNTPELSASQLADALQEHLDIDTTGYTVGPGIKLRNILESGNSMAVTMMSSDRPLHSNKSKATPAEDFDSLVCSADTVLVASVDAYGAHFTDNGRFIYTSYVLTPLNVLHSKSGITEGTPFKAYRMGGAITSGSHVVSVSNPSFRSLKPTDRVILLLQKGPSPGFMRLSAVGTFIVEGSSISNLDRRIHVHADKTDQASFIANMAEVYAKCK